MKISKKEMDLHTDIIMLRVMRRLGGFTAQHRKLLKVRELELKNYLKTRK